MGHERCETIVEVGRAVGDTGRIVEREPPTAEVDGCDDNTKAHSGHRPVQCKTEDRRASLDGERDE
jgi:hypothetical protein